METRERDAPMAHRMRQVVEKLQATVCDVLERLDGAAGFRSDSWEHRSGGGGLTRVIEGGAVFEKGGVNTSAVQGRLPDRMARAFGVEAQPFFATGISLVLHPRSPYVPAVHANFRYFALGADLHAPIDAWFGGGADLTPYYPYLDDARHFHRVWRGVCDRHPAVADYARFKQQCDDYFYLPHREETRGIGGIFFDYLRGDAEATFGFTQDAGAAFLDAYVPLVERRRTIAYGEAERAYQAIRRGRYAEFNLTYDRGTRFGLETQGRTESILMSLPPHVVWCYDWRPEPGSPEARAIWFFQPRDWLGLTEDDVGQV